MESQDVLKLIPVKPIDDRMIDDKFGCVPQRLAQTVAWFKPCSCLFTKWGSLTAQSGQERNFLKASGTQCSATCQPSTPPRTFLPAFVQRYFQTPVSIQTVGGIIVPSKVSTTCPHDIHAVKRRSEVLMRLCHRGMLLSLQGLVPLPAGSKFSDPQKEKKCPVQYARGEFYCDTMLVDMLMYHFNPWYRVIQWSVTCEISFREKNTFRAVPSYWSTKLVSLTS